ncbi:MAG: long-chain fatty acid--CoA ligase [Phycisphaeraceae bacterium]|nr:MAG: long-chain fatty acid--CoA ligase [Phycisphaeraceae bacterium]
MSVHWPIIRRSLLTPRRIGIVDDQRSWRDIELVIGALHLASEIERRSNSKTVGVMLPTTGLFPMAALAGWMLGRTLVPLNYLLKKDELRYVVRDCETDIVVTVQPMLDMVGELPDSVDILKVEDVSFKGLPEPRWPAHRKPDDLATLLYTSGTSGKPKGVMLTHGNLTENIRQCCEWVDFGRKDVILGVLPQFHSFGFTVLTLLPLTVGCKVIYSARFTPTKIIKLFRKHNPTAFIGLPSMYNALMSVKEAKAEDLASLRYTVSGGEPLSDAVFDRFKERFDIKIHEGYGLTETSPVTNWCRPFEFKRGSVGRALPRVDERIVDVESGRVLGAGKEGEVRIKGPNVMQGYFKLEEETRNAFDEDGYFRTGDMGRFDEDGHLSITGRIKEMLIIGGENVFPREIEEVLDKHETVEASGVIGVPDESRGETPLAFVQTKEDAEFDAKALRSWCREHLAGYKVPREIRHIDEMPRNPTGKIMRRELAEKLKEEPAKEQKQEAGSS